MEVFGHFVFPRFSGFFRAFSFVYRLFWAFLFTILFRHFVLPPINKNNFVFAQNYFCKFITHSLYHTTCYRGLHTFGGLFSF